MASVVRKLRRHLRRRGPHPAKALLAHEEGMRLARRLDVAAKAVGADPMDYLGYLNRMRRGYDPRHDGPSELMSLVDQIRDYELRKKAVE